MPAATAAKGDEATDFKRDDFPFNGDDLMGDEAARHQKHDRCRSETHLLTIAYPFGSGGKSEPCSRDHAEDRAKAE